MQKLIAAGFLICALFGASSSAQEQPSPKRQLILDFRKLTGADKVSGNLTFSAQSVREILMAIVTADKELSDNQKQALSKDVDEATVRIDKLAHSFLDDQPRIIKISEAVIFNIYDRTFSEAELRESIAFYKTPLGQKLAVFLPTLSNQVQTEMGAIIQTEMNNLIQPALKSESEQLSQKIKETKAGKT